MRPLLWDTCAAIWIFEDAKLAQPALDAIDAAHEANVPSYVSPITAWEVGMLAANERLKMLTTPERWFQRLFEIPNVELAHMSPELLIASSFLPGKPPRDPADRIIAATARDYGATLVTRDRALLDYGEQGHIRVLPC